ncbi:MAG: diacylglycerol kinase family protein [bacterium]
MKDTCIIFNPTAKGNRANRLMARICDLAPGIFVERTQKPHDARLFAKRAAGRGFFKIIAAGGDGTINEVVNGLAAFPDVCLGVLPMGTGNVLARELGIPNKMEDALAVIRQGRVKRIDVGLAGTRRFVQLAGVGLDAEVVRQTEASVKKNFGPLGYVFTLIQIAGRKPPRLEIRDAQGEERTGAFALVGNGFLYGGKFQVFPSASMTDGLLDVCVFKRQSHLDIIRYTLGFLRQTHTRFSDVEYFQTSRLWITSNEKTPVEVDGESHGYAPVDFSIKKRALKVIVP